MYHNIDFTQLGGFPLTQDTMEFIQQSYNDVLGVLTGIAGKYIIITGVSETTPNNYSNGWLIIDGEILPFIGGLGQPSVIVNQTTENYTFRNNSIHPVIIQRIAGFAASGGVPFSSFVRLSLSGLKTYIDQVSAAAAAAQATANAALAASGSFSAGMIMMWSGNPASVPAGWGLCDGLDGRPNLKGKFVVGYSAETGTYVMGATGGVASVTLTTLEMPSHTHNVPLGGSHSHSMTLRSNWGNDGGVTKVQGEDGGSTATLNTGSSSHTHTINNTGGGQAHENRPPYYTLAYIIRL